MGTKYESIQKENCKVHSEEGTMNNENFKTLSLEEWMGDWGFPIAITTVIDDTLLYKVKPNQKESLSQLILHT